MIHPGARLDAIVPHGVRVRAGELYSCASERREKVRGKGGGWRGERAVSKAGEKGKVGGKCRLRKAREFVRTRE